MYKQSFLKPFWAAKSFRREGFIWSGILPGFSSWCSRGRTAEAQPAAFPPLSHFSFLFKYSLHSSCSSWFHSFPTAGMKHEASALIQSSQTVGVLMLTSSFPPYPHYKNILTHFPISWELLETKPCRSIFIYLFLYFTKMWKDDQNGGENDMTLCHSLSLCGSASQRHRLGNLSRRLQSMRQQLVHAACDPVTLSSVVVSLCVIHVIEHVKGLFQQFITAWKGKFIQAIQRVNEFVSSE